MTRAIALGPGREFDAIRDLVARWGPAAVGIGDDAAVLDVPPGERLVVSTDATVENVHFRQGWLSGREIGYRATAAALSDLAAMAAVPLGMLVAIGVPPRWRSSIDQLADGIGDAAMFVRAPIVGGNLTAAEQLSLTLTVLGHVTRPLTRAAARPGDAVYVTGELGGPLAAVRAWEAGHEPAEAHRHRFAHPVPRVREARWLAAHGASAAIDISDGLVADLRHLAVASGVQVVIELETIPVVRGVSGVDAAASGEEFELAVVVPHPIDEHMFARELGVPLTRVGVVQAVGAEGPGVRLRAGGDFVDLPSGHDHFSH